jgi:hypothetical protein
MLSLKAGTTSSRDDCHTISLAGQGKTRQRAAALPIVVELQVDATIVRSKRLHDSL